MKIKSEEQKSRILVVDNHALVREGLRKIINQQSDLVCCGEADGIVAARTAVAACKPDVVTLGLRLRDGDGLELIKELKSQYTELPILVISSCDEIIYAERALKAGARGYVMKDRSSKEILAAIRAIMACGIYVSNKIAVLALHEMAGYNKPKSASRSLGNLSNRELEVLQLVGAGIGTRVIAARLSVSRKTIETHYENIKHKLGLSGCNELKRYATLWLEGNPPTLVSSGESLIRKSPDSIENETSRPRCISTPFNSGGRQRVQDESLHDKT